MAKFVCPKCDVEMSNGRSSMINEDVDHMHDKHDRYVSRDYVRGLVDAHSS